MKATISKQEVLIELIHQHIPIFIIIFLFWL